MRTCSTALAAAVLALTALIPSTSTSAHAAQALAAQAPAAPAPGTHTAGPPTFGSACPTGSLCLWKNPEFKGTKRTYELSTLEINSCTALPAGATAESLINRVGRPVTTYQSADCLETGEFQTYPGDGVWLPRSPYLVRAFKVWER
ncbi:peptidase inhibitor family I36 protein [Streptomyces sp. APSN-46.1]|uniref:peptidase inhibitor family I36 protein n=1 Tax=Streptomyces sp. APSN-46.1 TaxID=2929049 RepID=UPI001FB3008C|nr:peptidase inhibitor family I36 protein [Streptomyces sp. APSN-46.1]MCJ1677504.1 peptidase inhibitor family I36 protein [Streptomyces sp. APSN-46.1]